MSRRSEASKAKNVPTPSLQQSSLWKSLPQSARAAASRVDRDNLEDDIPSPNLFWKPTDSARNSTLNSPFSIMPAGIVMWVPGSGAFWTKVHSPPTAAISRDDKPARQENAYMPRLPRLQHSLHAFHTAAGCRHGRRHVKHHRSGDCPFPPSDVADAHGNEVFAPRRPTDSCSLVLGADEASSLGPLALLSRLLGNGKR